MYSTKGINSIATITELRAKTNELIDEVGKNDDGVLIQKNNEPLAVILSPERYAQLRDAEEKLDGKRGRGRNEEEGTFRNPRALRQPIS
jgi:prevent-host-death family protein